MRLLVTGGRHYTDAVALAWVFDRALIAVLAADSRLVIVHGACRVRRGEPWDHHTPKGADGLAHRWALWRAAEGAPVDVEAHPADYVGSRCLGPPRNAAMVALGADACVAFPGGSGTADCLRRAREAGIRCAVVDAHGELSWDSKPPGDSP